MSTSYSYEQQMSVKWGDCDAAGISYYAKNFDWYADGRIGFLDHYGLPYMDTFHRQGITLVVLKAESDYKKMLLPLEEVTLRTNLAKLSRTRMMFTYEILKENGELAAKGMTLHAFVNGDGIPVNLKKKFPQLWEAMSRTWKELDLS